ncbi:MAG: ion transporter [Pseudomonadales bacterium]|nr:ion transporter [Pseudomonadales bacterium]
MNVSPQSDNRDDSLRTLREKVYLVIFGTETPMGRLFDEVLLVAILASVLIVVLSSVASLSGMYGEWFYSLEWLFTVAFTIEYGLRLYCSPNPLRYARSFFGVVDFLSIVPTYIAFFFFPGAEYLLIIRLLRVLRVFRVLKLVRYLREANVLGRSIYNSRRKILVFFFSILVLVTIYGALMYVIEGSEYGFSSIPKGMYWAIVTITTVGYGDIAPQTELGRMLAALVMLTGYAIIAVPTGIITAELVGEMQQDKNLRVCPNCECFGHDNNAVYCKLCGSPMEEESTG